MRTISREQVVKRLRTENPWWEARRLDAQPWRRWKPRAYFERLRAHAPDAWIDESKTKVGYEIPFNRHFYVFEPPRPLEVIDAELKQVAGNIMRMLGELVE